MGLGVERPSASSVVGGQGEGLIRCGGVKNDNDNINGERK
jgi:hypothetical protein